MNTRKTNLQTHHKNNWQIIRYTAWFVMLFFFGMAQAVDENAKFVWNNETGKGVQTYLYFRNDVEIVSSTDVQEIIHLFAYSRYVLYINGNYVNFGPSRSFPKEPYYDTYNISP